MKLLSAILFIGVFVSCCSAKKEAGTNYSSGTIVHATVEGDCPYTIKVVTGGYVVFYDPINLENNYMKDGLKVQFQFRPLKMKNRCDKANPISLSSIQKQ